MQDIVKTLDVLWNLLLLTYYLLNLRYILILNKKYY